MSKIIKIGYGKVKPIKLGSNLPLVLAALVQLKVAITLFLWLKKLKKYETE